MNKVIFILCFSIISILEVKADHMLGGELTYKTLDSGQGIFQIKLTLDRYCSGGAYSTSQEIEVVEYSQGSYKSSKYNAILSSTEYIALPCGQSSSGCTGSNSQLIERTHYTVNIFTEPTDKECIILYRGNNRVLSNNIQTWEAPMLLYLSFVPKYLNHQLIWKEAKRNFPIKSQLSMMNFESVDLEMDSVQVKSSAPFETISYSISGGNLNYNIAKSLFNIGLNVNKPLYINESNISISKDKIEFTPSQIQSSWLNIVKSELRKLTIGGVDTWVVISKSNIERLISVSQINTNFRLDTILSPNSNVTISNKSITICHQGDTSEMKFRFPIEKGLAIQLLSIFWNKIKINSQLSSQIFYGNVVDTVEYTWRYKHNDASDFYSKLEFRFDICHSSSQIGFTKSFEVPVTIFHYKIFAQDTIQTCSPTVSIPILISKPILSSWGLSQGNFIYISSPRDTIIYAHLLESNSHCPSQDTIVLNHGVVFTKSKISYSPSCKGYGDGSAKVNVVGTNTPYSFLWSNFSTQDTIGSLFAGNHIVCITDKDNCKQYDTVTIVDPKGIEGEFLIDTPITCYGSSNGRGHIVISSVLKPNFYLWNHNASSDSFMGNLSSGVYTGKYRYVNDSNKICNQDFSFNISDPDTIELDITKYDNICFGESNGKLSVIPRGGKPPYQFYFNGNYSSTGLKINLINGSYSIYVIDSLGCQSSTKNVSITSPARIAINFSIVNPTCPQTKNGSFTINHTTGGVSPYYYSFEGSAYLPTIVYPNLTPNNYIIYTKDANGCIVPQNFTLTPQYILNGVKDSVVHSACPLSNSGKVGIAMTNGSKPFLWTINSISATSTNGNFLIPNLKKGFQRLKITDNNGCEWKDSFLINEPDSVSPFVIVTDESCYQKKDGSLTVVSLIGGTPPFNSLKWYNSQNLAQTSTVNLPPDTYKLVLEDSRNCISNFHYTIKAKPVFKLSIDLVKPISCHGYNDGKLYANVEGGVVPISYRWDNSAMTSDSLHNVMPGTHMVEVTDADNCKLYASTSLIEPNPIIVDDIKVKNSACGKVSTGSISIFCSGGSVPNGKLEYSLYGIKPYSTNNHFTNLSPNNYTVQVRDERLCELSLVRSILSEKGLNLSLPPNYSFDLGDNFILSPTISYDNGTTAADIKSSVWTPTSGITCADCIQTNFTAIQSGNYTITLNYGNGCTASASTKIIVSKPDDVYIPNSFSPNNDQKNDVWNVYGKHVQSIDIRVLNRVGELVFHSTDINKGWDGTFRGAIEQMNAYKYEVKVVYLDNSSKQYEGILHLIK